MIGTRVLLFAVPRSLHTHPYMFTNRCAVPGYDDQSQDIHLDSQSSTWTLLYPPDAPNNQSRTIHNTHGTPMSSEDEELQRHDQPNQETDNEHRLWPRVVGYQTEEEHQ